MQPRLITRGVPISGGNRRGPPALGAQSGPSDVSSALRQAYREQKRKLTRTTRLKAPLADSRAGANMASRRSSSVMAIEQAGL